MKEKCRLYLKCKHRSGKEERVREKDIATKQFFRVNERFADLINGTLYEGKQVVDAYELEEIDTELNEKIKHAQTEHRRRDCIKRCKKDGVVYALYGAEYQSTVDETMPIRIMEYDALTYLKMHETEKKLHPIVTVCLYTGEKKWDKPMSLFEMMEVPQEMKELVQDYRINVVQALQQDADKYQNQSVKEFFELMHDVHELNRYDLVEKYGDRILSSPEAVETVAVLTNDKELKKLSVMDREGNKVCQNFRKIVEEIRDEGRAEGRAEGMIAGFEKGREDGKAEGKTETLKSVVKQLKSVGAAYDMIMTVTGLSQDEVESIA